MALRSVKTDVLILGVASVAVLLAAVLLLVDLRARPPQVFVEPVGYLERAWNNVQLRGPGSSAFRKAQPEGMLRNGDEVRTGAGSGVVVRINDGTSVELAELSMVSMEVGKDGMRLRFEGKGLRLQRNGAASPLSLETAEGRLIVHDADMRVFNDGRKVFVDRGGVTSKYYGGDAETLKYQGQTPAAGDDPFSVMPKEKGENFSSLFSHPNPFTPAEENRSLLPPDISGVEVKQRIGR